MNKFGLKVLIVVVFVAFTLYSCKVFKGKKRTHKTVSLEKVYDSLKLAELDYRTLKIKFNVKYKNSTKNMSLKGNLRIRKDSVIWVSLSPGFGIEAARIMCTKDSIFLMNKLDKTLTKGKYEYIKKLWKVDVDYNSLQSILTDRFFIYPSTDSEKKEFTKSFIVKNDSTDIEVYRRTSENVENLVKIKPSNYKVFEYMINDIPNRRNLSVKYENGDSFENRYFPKKIHIRSTNVGKLLNVDLSYTKVLVNKGATFSFKIPSTYKVIVR